MNVHEYQAKEVLKKYGISIPAFGIASTREEAEQVVKDLSLKEAVVKVQVHAGGRGKAGGVKFGKTPEEIIDVAEKMVGLKIVNEQTGSQGIVAKEVMISVATDIAQEYYVGVVMDRDTAQPMLIASPEGGMDIEEVAANTPEKIITMPVGLDGKIRGYKLFEVAKFMGWSGSTAKQGMKTIAGLAKAFIDTDASLLEINPLVSTPDGEIWALDAKLSVDENALFRQKQIESYYDPSHWTFSEVEAKKHDLAYIALEGSIGCMVNGAGLAMATLDIIHHYGADPANFLDVGGSASKEKVAAAFRIILSDPQVRAILVNIFGGIMNCATIAEGVVAAIGEVGVKVPLIVRLEGTNVDEGRRILNESGLNIISADSLADAAQKAVASIKA
jgi:succinyl-CoA synthetase beta subunit